MLTLPTLSLTVKRVHTSEITTLVKLESPIYDI